MAAGFPMAAGRGGERRWQQPGGEARLPAGGVVPNARPPRPKCLAHRSDTNDPQRSGARGPGAPGCTARWAVAGSSTQISRDRKRPLHTCACRCLSESWSNSHQLNIDALKDARTHEQMQMRLPTGRLPGQRLDDRQAPGQVSPAFGFTNQHRAAQRGSLHGSNRLHEWLIIWPLCSSQAHPGIAVRPLSPFPAGYAAAAASPASARRSCSNQQAQTKRRTTMLQVQRVRSRSKSGSRLAGVHAACGRHRRGSTAGGAMKIQDYQPCSIPPPRLLAGSTGP